MPRYTAADIDNQLQTLYLQNAADLGSNSDHALTVALSPILKSIAASKQEQQYINQLKSFVARKEDEIESICKANYQDFIESTDKLLKVRQGTVSLKHRVAELNEDIQSKGGQLAAKKRILLDNKRVSSNIDETIDTLTACLRVLDLYLKVETLIKEQKYYSALRTLDELANNQIKTVSNISASFANSILQTLPRTRNLIKDASLKELKAWFFEAREKSQLIGQKALQQMEVRSRRWKVRKSKDVDGALRLAKVNSAVELVVCERHAHEYDVFQEADSTDAVSMDFKPLYHCILIHDLLESRDDLQSSYLGDRRAQASLLLSSVSLTHFTISGLTALLEEMTGFFLIEQHVQNRTPSNFRPDRDIQDLWHSTIEKTISAISDGLRTCSQVEEYLDAKLRLQLFSLTLSSYGYDLSLFNSFLNSLFGRFVELLEKKSSVELEAIIQEDEHFQMLVSDLEDFDKVASVSWLPASGQWSEQALRE